MSWECCLVESRWRYNELLIRTQSSVTSLFSTVFGNRQQVFELEWHISAFAVLVRSVVDIFPSFSLSFPSVSQCLLLYDLDERDKVRPCEGMLNRTDADCAWESCVSPWTEKKMQNQTKSGFSSSHPDIDPAITFLLFLASPFRNGHCETLRI